MEKVDWSEHTTPEYELWHMAHTSLRRFWRRKADMVPYQETVSVFPSGITIHTEEPVHEEGDGFILYFYSEFFGELRFLDVVDEYGWDFRTFLQCNPPGTLEVDRWRPSLDMPLSSIWSY